MENFRTGRDAAEAEAFWSETDWDGPEAVWESSETERDGLEIDRFRPAMLAVESEANRDESEFLWESPEVNRDESEAGWVNTETGRDRLGGADRAPDSTYVRAGMLTKVTYPTGGYSQFTYELNSYGAVGSSISSIFDDGPEQNQVANSSAGLVSNPFTVGGTEPVIATIYTNQSPSGCGQQIFPPCPYTELIVGGTTYRWDDNGIHFVTLPVGTYAVTANAQNQGTAGITVFWHNRIAVTSKNAGGVRVKEIRTGDGTGSGNDQIRKYIYTLQADPARSSGAISVEPRYEYPYGSGTCSFWSRSSQSKLPLGRRPGGRLP